MDSTLDFVRSRALNCIPQRKLQAAIDAINNSEDSLENKTTKLIAINRYAECNIPIEYWYLKMERDFKGDPRLLEKHNEYVSDLKASYMSGTSICFAGKHGLGKQLSLDTELPTPNGFVKLIDLKEGDRLFDENGDVCKVIRLHPIDLLPESYRITFDDGEVVEACSDHLWLTHTRKSRVNNNPPTVKTTKEILQTIRFKNGIREGANHSIACSKPIKYPAASLPIDPYVLGCWLGDGSSNDGGIECADHEILENIKLAGYSVNICPSSISDKSKSCRYRVGDLVDSDLCRNKIGLLKLQLRELGLLGNKHIPDIYLYSSYEQRLSLLQGILDTDGCCNKGGAIEFCSVIPKLANQVCQLVRSFGIKAKVKVNESWLYDKKCKDRYRVSFATKLPVFRLQRKLDNIRLEKRQLSRTEHRFIVSIDRIDPKPMRCITVDSPSSLFLITRSFIATHNTFALTSILKKACNKGYSCLYSTLSDVVGVLTQNGSEDKVLARRELVMVDFLVIDEFDARFMPSENAADLYARSLESVFRARSQNKLPTLMATNSPNPVESFNGALRDSIDSLMSGYMQIFTVAPGKDHRKEKP